MANVLFKRGLQSTLSANNFTPQDGVFYLTQDTNRLYIGEGNELKLLNQTVQIVSNLSDLVTISNGWNETQKAAHTYDFFYIAPNGGDTTNTHSGNILVVWDGTQWVQINPDTNTTVTTVTVSTTAASANSITTDINIADSAGTPHRGNFTISAAGGVSATANGSNITLTGETYTLSRSVANDNESATVTLDATLGSDSSVVLTNGGNISFTAGVDNSIEISAVDTKIGNTSLTMPADGSLNISIQRGDTTSSTSTLANVGVAVGAGTGNVGNYYLPITNTSGKTAANIYTAAEIDNLINGLDGMTFKGTLGDAGVGTVVSLPTSNVRNGDTYVIVKSGMTSSEITGLDPTTGGAIGDDGTRIGDMLIANGTEGSDGYLQNGFSWIYVPSGNDSSDTFNYHGVSTTATNTIALYNNVSGSAAIAQLSLTEGTDIDIVSTASASNVLNATISHATYSAVTAVATANPTTRQAAFTAIKELTLTNGHVTGIETDTFTPITYTINGATATQGSTFSTTSTYNNVVTTIGLVDDNTTSHGSASIDFSSSSITLSASANGAVVMDLVWGTF